VSSSLFTSITQFSLPPFLPHKGVPSSQYTNYQGPQFFRRTVNLKYIFAEKGVKNFFLKKNLNLIFFFLRASRVVGTKAVLKLESLTLISTFFQTHVLLILKKFKKYAIFFGGPQKLLEFILLIFITLNTKDLSFFRG
jgi:hypothetical protein